MRKREFQAYVEANMKALREAYMDQKRRIIELEDKLFRLQDPAGLSYAERDCVKARKASMRADAIAREEFEKE